MVWLERYRMKRAARAMSRKLPPILAREWGRAEYYTPQQVRRALEMAGLAGRYDFIAFAVFLDRQAYEADAAAVGHAYDFVRQLFDEQRAGGLAGAYSQSPISNSEAASRYGVSGLP